MDFFCWQLRAKLENNQHILLHVLACTSTSNVFHQTFLVSVTWKSVQALSFWRNGNIHLAGSMSAGVQFTSSAVIQHAAAHRKLSTKIILRPHPSSRQIWQAAKAQEGVSPLTSHHPGTARGTGNQRKGRQCPTAASRAATSFQSKLRSHFLGALSVAPARNAAGDVHDGLSFTPSKLRTFEKHAAHPVQVADGTFCSQKSQSPLPQN